MPLSPQERQRLAEIEAGLRADPDFQLEPTVDRRHQRMRRTAAVAMMLIGIALAVTGAAMAPRSFVVGFIVILVGFITVVGGAVVWFTAGDRRAA